MKTVVWDVDDVLNRLMLDWFTLVWKPANPSSGVEYTNIATNPPHLLGLGPLEYLASLDDFRVSENARNMIPNAAVLEWLSQHGARARHMVLTARPLPSAPHVSEWVFRHFGGYVRTVAVVPSRLEAAWPPYDRSKEEYLRWLGRANILVDDNEENIRAARRLGMHGLLFPQPWNSSRQTEAELLAELTEILGVS
jgi:FMN phosphatase YigB (HAD superfamily)